MRILVCEYVTGGGLAGQRLPPSLAREGDMMLASLVKDLGALSGVDVVATRDARLPATDLPADFRVVESGDDSWSLWSSLVRTVDALWPIAPEASGLLERLSRLTPDSPVRLIGCTPEAIRLTASKRATAAHLAAAGVPVVPTWPPGAIDHTEAGWVAKPDHGAGCDDTFLFSRRSDLEARLARRESKEQMVVQPYVPGPAGSLSVLCAGGDVWLLACNRQEMALHDGRFHYLGSVVGGLEARRAVYKTLAAQVGEAIPGLWGHVGIDFVESTAGPVVLEVNPRLTTSYAGLHRALGVNPAGLVLDLLEQDIRALRRPLACAPVAVEVAAVCHA